MEMGNVEAWRDREARGLKGGGGRCTHVGDLYDIFY